MTILSASVTRWRGVLDDLTEPYLWSNEELTVIADRIQKDLCSEMPIIIDRTTAAVCQVTVTASTQAVTIDPRIVRILSARITGETSPLGVRSSNWMDSMYGDWANKTEEDTPTILVHEGYGIGQAGLYPLPEDTTTMDLVVVRRPLVTLVYATHNTLAMEIDRYEHLIDNGIYSYAYLKQDTDTFDPQRAERHRILWEGENRRGGDKDLIKRAVLREFQDPQGPPVHLAFT